MPLALVTHAGPAKRKLKPTNCAPKKRPQPLKQ
nr:MAG TPA: hypothetical protein [Caudoviricetes sp.]